MHFKEGNTIRNLLVALKAKDNITNKSGLVYRFKCTQVVCEEEYISERGRSFGDRLKEHLRALSTIYKHANTSGHCINVEHFFIVGREVHCITRTIKEAMLIRINGPSLNRNLGKFQLPHI